MSSIANHPLSEADLQDRIDTVLRADDFGRSSWHSSSAQPLTLTYRFETSPAADFPWSNVGGGFQAYSAAEQAAVRAALTSISDVANVAFVETSLSDPDPVLSLYQAFDLYTDDAGLTGGGRGRWRFSGDEWDGHVVFNAAYDLSQDSRRDLLVHEILHALGLKHPGDYDIGGNTPPGPFLDATEDNDLYTLMSYNHNTVNGLESRELLLYDIAALQAWWGTNTRHARGDDTYGPNADGRMRVIWDAGGSDSILYSATAAELDLRAGAFSRLGPLTNFAIAYGTTIEHAITGDGADTIQGNAAANRIDGWSGDDTVRGENGEDTLIGGDGDDSLRGDDQNDTVIGGDGRDTLTGDRGDDSVEGQDGDDQLWGWLGLDYLNGGQGQDLLNGEEDSDTLDGWSGDDTLEGGQGWDSLIGGDGADLLRGGSENDTLLGGNGNDTLEGGTGDDLLFGDDDNDLLLGGTGDDILEGVRGNDTLDGGSGNDVVSGGEGDDSLQGEAGNDTLWGYIGNDTLDGGAGDDLLRPEGGSDLLIFTDTTGNDTVLGFDATDDAEDINFAGVVGITDFNDLSTNHMSQQGTDVLIDTGTGSILLVDVALGDLHEADFSFTLF